MGNPENLIGWSDSNRDQSARAMQGGLARVKDVVAKTQGLSKKNAEAKLETVGLVLIPLVTSRQRLCSELQDKSR